MEFQRKRALLFGVNQYKHVSSLKCCANDVVELERALTSKLGFGKEDVWAFSDLSPGRPTRANFYHHLGKLADETATDDLLLVYFLGHGMINKNDSKDYLLPNDASPYSPAHTAIKVDDLADILTGSICKNKVIFIDACREAISGEKRVMAVGQEAKSVLDREGIATFFSCDPADRPYEIEEISHSTFTYCILSAINDGIDRTVSQLDTYLREHVPTTNQKYNKPPQMPFLILNPSEIGGLPLFRPLKEVSNLTPMDAMFGILEDLYEQEVLEIAVYAKALDVLIRIRDQKPQSADECKHAIIKLLCRKEIGVEAFSLTWKQIEKHLSQSSTQANMKAEKPS